MKKTQRGFFLGLCIVAAVFMFTLGHAQEGAKDKVKLTGAELEKTGAEEAVFAGFSPNGCAWMNVFFATDSKIRQSWDCWDTSGTTWGTYRVVDDKRCIKWDDPNRPFESCFEFYRIGEAKYEAWLNGVPIITFYRLK